MVHFCSFVFFASVGYNRQQICRFDGCDRAFTQLGNLKVSNHVALNMTSMHVLLPLSRNDRMLYYTSMYTPCSPCSLSTFWNQTHERKHTGERPYKCPHPDCDKTFTQLGNLKTHERIHDEVKPFMCRLPGCGKTFSQLGNLKVRFFSTMFIQPNNNYIFFSSAPLSNNPF